MEFFINKVDLDEMSKIMRDECESLKDQIIRDAELKIYQYFKYFNSMPEEIESEITNKILAYVNPLNNEELRKEAYEWLKDNNYIG